MFYMHMYIYFSPNKFQNQTIFLKYQKKKSHYYIDTSPTSLRHRNKDTYAFFRLFFISEPLEIAQKKKHTHLYWGGVGVKNEKCIRFKVVRRTPKNLGGKNAFCFQ